MFQACSHNYVWPTPFIFKTILWSSYCFIDGKTEVRGLSDMPSHKPQHTPEPTGLIPGLVPWSTLWYCRGSWLRAGLWAWQICTQVLSLPSPTCWPWTNYPASLNLILLFACLTGLLWVVNELIPGWMYPNVKNKQNQYCFKMNQYWIKMSVLPDLILDSTDL